MQSKTRHEGTSTTHQTDESILCPLKPASQNTNDITLFIATLATHGFSYKHTLLKRHTLLSDNDLGYAYCHRSASLHRILVP